jgi:hypothetical protein
MVRITKRALAAGTIAKATGGKDMATRMGTETGTTITAMAMPTGITKTGKTMMIMITVMAITMIR